MMRTIKFPKMFNTNNTRVWKSSEYLDATKQSTELLLHTTRGELFGDPYFGLMLKRYLFDQNSYILKDAIIDMIYTQLSLFIPQVKVKREDIEIIQDREKGKLYCTFSGVSQIDYTHNTYNLLLFDERD
jgi:phage baseplate assembly protein W